MPTPFFSRSRLLTTVGLSLALGLALSAPASAQTAGQITPDSFAPPVIRSESGGLTLSAPSGLKAPEGAEALTVTPSGMVVEGGLPDIADETAAIAARLTNKTVSGADLFAAARDLETAAIQAGHILTRVVLPPQTLKDGDPLRLTLVTGHVEAVDASALPERVRGRVEDLLASFVGRTDVTQAALERRLLLAGDIPGILLRSTLAPGTEEGGTILVIEGRQDPFGAFLTLDNGLSDSLGTFTFGLGLDANSLLGLGETAYLRVGGYPGTKDGTLFDSDPRNRQLAGGVIVPLGVDAPWFNLEAVQSQTHGTTDLAYTLSDDFFRATAKLGYTWIRGREANTASTLAFDLINEAQTLHFSGQTFDFTEDRLRVLRLGQTGDITLPWGATLSGSATASFGVNALGAREATTALPLSRDGAKPSFQKLEGTLGYTQNLFADRTRLSLAGKAQTSFGQTLPSSEMFSLGGADWLSAFDSGTFSGDMGAAGRAELSAPFTSALLQDSLPGLGGAAAPYLFGALGAVKLEQPSAVERGITMGSSMGVGLRLGLSQQATAHGAMLSAEYALGSAAGKDTENRFNLRMMVRF
ncbi:ShlB/FhaC/HecB family hemolysin secretion/activation protein [Rhodospirillum sp. A1_3_36]|uniref:ShlB/FhaC/HecB family hemolysin secretion/activation protein n=1 Tax=Rhodospirillum sp. A1_3_36 TaxID=3391666 RepID=UPI0039A5F3B3